jgi:2-hydroxy-6-oxonona-2,4-dienedioate hydrolase
MRVILFILAGAVAAAGAVYVLYSQDMSAAHDRLAGRSKTLVASLGVMEYATMGEGEPALVIHGASGGFDQSLDMTGALAPLGFRLIAPSRFGYLGSDMPTAAAPATQADAYVELLDKLGIERAAVIAISAGAWSALQFAIRHPQRCRALILLVPANDLPEGASIYGGSFVRAILNSDFLAWAVLKAMPVIPGALTRLMLGTDAAVVRAANDSEKARIQKILDHLLPMGPRRQGTEFDVKTAATREPYPIERIACPVLTMSAEDDPFGTATRARDIAAGVERGKAVIFPSGGHALVGHYEYALREGAAFAHAAATSEAPR